MRELIEKIEKSGNTDSVKEIEKDGKDNLNMIRLVNE